MAEGPPAAAEAPDPTRFESPSLPPPPSRFTPLSASLIVVSPPSSVFVACERRVSALAGS